VKTQGPLELFTLLNAESGVSLGLGSKIGEEGFQIKRISIINTSIGVLRTYLGTSLLLHVGIQGGEGVTQSCI
jgi:hypothetical protein